MDYLHLDKKKLYYLTGLTYSGVSAQVKRLKDADTAEGGYWSATRLGDQRQKRSSLESKLQGLGSQDQDLSWKINR